MSSTLSPLDVSPLTALLAAFDITLQMSKLYCYAPPAPEVLEPGMGQTLLGY